MAVYKIQHITQYDYDGPVIDSTNQIKIYPYTSDGGQRLIQFDLSVTGNPVINVFNDYWGNQTGVFAITEPHNKMTIESRMVIETIDPVDDPAPLSPIVALDYTHPDIVESAAQIKAMLAQCPESEIEKIADWANRFVFENFTYEKGITTIETTVDEIVKHGKGVCQDFAHVLLQLLRTAGIPARYVSGYICPNKDGMRGEGATHAWVEVWLAGKGWRGIDPTNNVWVNKSHVRLAVGRSFSDCTPAKGTFKGMANQRLNVYVSVGYEDGHVFEEETQVKMNEERILIPAIIPKYYYAQQQQ